MALLRRGNRLSVMLVTAEQWEFILELESSGRNAGAGVYQLVVDVLQRLEQE